MYMSKYTFLITSAINTKFGVFDAETRLNQTVSTIQSIKQRVPDADLFLLEMSAIALTQDQSNTLEPLVKSIVNFNSDPSVVGLYKSNNVAVSVIIKLVKKDLETLVQEHRIKILNGESIEENRNSLQIIKQSLYQIKTIEFTKMTHIIIGDRSINRFKIIMVEDDERERTEVDLISY